MGFVDMIHQWSWLITLGITIVLVPSLRKLYLVGRQLIELMNATAEGTKENLHHNIMQDGGEYLRQGYVTSDKFDDFDRECNVYFRLHGNGSGKRMYKEVTALPQVPPERASTNKKE